MTETLVRWISLLCNYLIIQLWIASECAFDALSRAIIDRVFCGLRGAGHHDRFQSRYQLLLYHFFLPTQHVHQKWNRLIWLESQFHAFSDFGDVGDSVIRQNRRNVDRSLSAVFSCDVHVRLHAWLLLRTLNSCRLVQSTHWFWLVSLNYGLFVLECGIQFQKKSFFECRFKTSCWDL